MTDPEDRNGRDNGPGGPVEKDALSTAADGITRRAIKEEPERVRDPFDRSQWNISLHASIDSYTQPRPF